MGGVIFLWAASLLWVRAFTRRRLLRLLAQEGIQPEDLEIRLDHPRPQDQAALELIRTYRRRYLLQLWPETRFSFAAINNLSQQLVKEIARIYHPEEERPELRASLADLVALYSRVGARVQSWLDTMPMRPLKDVELATVLRVHEVYQKITQHPTYRFFKRHHLDKVARLAWAAQNIVNPWYWGRKVAYTGSREMLARLFMAKVAATVGEEAIRLYGRRPLNSRRAALFQTALQEMVNITLEDGQLPPPVASFLLTFFLKAKGLEDQDRLGLLTRLATPRRRQIRARESLEPREAEQLYQWLQQMVKTCYAGEEQRRRLEELQKTWPEGASGGGG